MITKVPRTSCQQSRFQLKILQCALVITGCIASSPSYSLARGMKMSCSDTHSQYIQNGIKYERPADAKYILQVDGDILLEEFEGFANIYKSKVVWRDDGYIVAVQHDQIGGSGISTVSLALRNRAQCW